MKKQSRKLLSFVLALVMFLGVTVPVQAAKKVKLSSTKVTVRVGKTKTIRVKNTSKKIKWSVVKGKAYIKLTKKNKQSVVVKGKKAGKAKILAKAGKKKLYCKVTVKGGEVPVPDPVTLTPGPSVQPSVQPQASQPAGTTQPGGQVSSAPSQTPQPGDNASSAPSQEPSAVPSAMPSQSADPNGKQPGDPVENLSIDLSGYTTKFTAVGKINFSDQIESWFDLTLFSKLKVNYVLEFEDDDSSDFVNGKIGLAATADTLTGYDDGVAFSYGMTKSGATAEVDLSGEALEGKVVGINIQPMNASYTWPSKLVSVTITGIEFVAAGRSRLSGSECAGKTNGYTGPDLCAGGIPV